MTRHAATRLGLRPHRRGRMSRVIAASQFTAVLLARIAFPDPASPRQPHR